MENKNSTIEQPFYVQTELLPKIYSKKAIWGFSVFFSAIFGGVLLMLNLKSIGKKKEANFILAISIFYTLLIMYIVNIPEKPISSISYLFNMIGGGILSEYYFKKHFSSEGTYENKKIWKPLIISILITIPFILAIIYGE